MISPYPFEFQPDNPFKGIHSFTVLKELIIIRCLYSEQTRALQIHIRWQKTGQWYRLVVFQANVASVMPWFRTTEQFYAFMRRQQGVGCSFDPTPNNTPDTPTLTIRDSTPRKESLKLFMEARPSTQDEERDYNYSKIEERNKQLEQQAKEIRAEVLTASLRWKIAQQQIKNLEEQNKCLKIDLKKAQTMLLLYEAEKSQLTYDSSSMDIEQEIFGESDESSNWVKQIVCSKPKGSLLLQQQTSDTRPTAQQPASVSQIDSSYRSPSVRSLMIVD